MYKTEGTKVVVQLRKTLAKSNLGEHAHYSDIHNRDTEHKWPNCQSLTWNFSFNLLNDI